MRFGIPEPRGIGSKLSGAYHAVTDAPATLGSGVSRLYHSATDTLSDAARTSGSALSDAYQTVSGTASTFYHRASGTANTASGYVDRAQNRIDRGICSAEDWVDQSSHSLAARVANIPVVGGIARGIADDTSFKAQVAGGVGSGLTTAVSGIAHAALHPLDTAMGLEAMVEHTPSPIRTAVRGAHDLVDMARGQRSFGSMINRAVNPLATAKEDAQFWGSMGSAVIEPYRASAREGRYGHTLGRGIFDVGSLLLGVGEAGDAGRALGTAGRAGDIADATRGMSIAGDTERIAEVADGGRMTKAVSDGAHSVGEAGSAADAARTAAPGRNMQPLSQAELDLARQHALKLGMPEDKICLEMGRGEKTSWGQMFGEERLFITEDVKPAPPQVPAPGQGKSLSANQRVSIKGAMSHEVVGHREADLAGHSQTKSYSHYADLAPEQRATEHLVDNARDEAQASLRAAKFAPGLANGERKILFKDAMERLAKIGLGVDDVPGLNLFLETR